MLQQFKPKPVLGAIHGAARLLTIWDRVKTYEQTQVLLHVICLHRWHSASALENCAFPVCCCCTLDRAALHPAHHLAELRSKSRRL